MLPGFRFLFAAILLCISLLVFGVGAAALLRATHEEFVANPAWRNGPQERVFAQATEPAQPVLATLRAEPEPTPVVPSLRDQVPTIGLPNEVGPTDIATPEARSEPAVQVADIRPTEPPAAEPTQVQVTAAPPADLPASQPAAAEPANAAAETAPVTTDATPSIVASTLEPADTVVSPPPAEAATNATKIAALPDATMSEKPSASKAKATGSTPDTATKRRAQRPKKRHRIVRRPPPPPLVQQTYDPFAQPQPQPAFAAATTTRKR
jgi:hypothetical protein